MSYEDKINKLENVHTDKPELVSLYIPPKKPITETLNQLKQEYAIANNIKLDYDRYRIHKVLGEIINYLKEYDDDDTKKKYDENGLIIFCGYVEGDKLELYPILPSKPVKLNLYRCDNHFYVDPLKEWSLSQ